MSAIFVPFRPSFWIPTSCNIVHISYWPDTASATDRVSTINKCLSILVTWLVFIQPTDPDCISASSLPWQRLTTTNQRACFPLFLQLLHPLVRRSLARQWYPLCIRAPINRYISSAWCLLLLLRCDNWRAVDRHVLFVVFWRLRIRNPGDWASDKCRDEV